jgi:hypothetical protein
MKTYFSVDKRITIGELITVLSIVFSAVSVLITWRNEQNIQILENATRTRVEIAKTMNTLNQVVQLQLSFYELIEEDIVEASRISIVEKDPIKSRDYMYEKLHKHRAEVLNIIAQKDWEVAYTNLLTYGIQADSLYIKTITRLKGLQTNEFNNLVMMFEDELMNYRPTRETQTSYLIDKLREDKNEIKQDHLNLSKKATAEFFTFCLDHIRETDKKLLFAAKTSTLGSSINRQSP